MPRNSYYNLIEISLLCLLIKTIGHIWSIQSFIDSLFIFSNLLIIVFQERELILNQQLVSEIQYIYNSYFNKKLNHFCKKFWHPIKILSFNFHMKILQNTPSVKIYFNIDFQQDQMICQKIAEKKWINHGVYKQLKNFIRLNKY